MLFDQATPHSMARWEMASALTKRIRSRTGVYRAATWVISPSRHLEMQGLTSHYRLGDPSDVLADSTHGPWYGL